MRHGLGGKRAWLAAGLWMLAGCTDTCGATTEPGAIGELGNGDFFFTCGGSSDPACERSAGGSDVDYFPECIALGGAFDLEYQLLDDSALERDTVTPVLYIESVNQGFFSGSDDFVAVRPGSAAFVVRESERVLDLIHLTIVEPDRIDVVARDSATPITSLELSVGTTEELRVFPRSESCTQLGGAVPISARSSDETIASTFDGELVRIEAHAPGTAVIRVNQGELEQQITVQVVGTPIDPDTGPGSGSGSDGSSGGSGSESGSGSGSESGSTTGGGSTDTDTDGASTGGTGTSSGGAT